MFGGIHKVPTTCPHCGFVQNEPRGLISTYCRGCGGHYSVAPAEQAPPRPHVHSALAERLRETLHLPRKRRIACHSCGCKVAVPVHAETASVCPSCGTTIHLHDITIHGHVTRPVHTRGTIHVGREGYLNAMRVACGNAIVEGRIAGRVTCEGTLRLRGEGVCRAQISTRRLIIDRGAELRFPFTIYADEVIIRGRIEADVHCAGSLHIGRTGGLEGDVEARAMLVDKGGSYAGDVKVHADVKRPEREVTDEPDVRPISAWHAPRLAFG